MSPDRHIAICVDTSGSIDSQLLSIFSAECRAILAISGISVYLITADAQVSAVIEPGEPFPASFTGGGGTDFRPAIEKSVSLSVDGVVYLTDGDGEYGSQPAIPVLWALSKRSSSPPWGEKIYIEKEQ